MIGKKKEALSSICEEAEGVLETADLDPVGMAPHEEVRKGKFRNGRRELGKEGIEEGVVFEDSFFKLRECWTGLPQVLHFNGTPSSSLLARQMMYQGTDLFEVEGFVNKTINP